MKNLLVTSFCFMLSIPAVAVNQYSNSLQPPIDYTLKGSSPFDSFNKGFKQAQKNQRINLDIERMKLENERLRFDIQKAKQAQDRLNIVKDEDEDEDEDED